VFAVPEVDTVLQQRCADFDIHPSGPLWGAGATRLQGEPAALEARVLAQYPQLIAGLERTGLEQDRRALRVWVRNLTWTHAGTQLILRFRLHRGAFATAVIAELVGAAASEFGENEDA
jgi:tRNA pseudouridine13 synthase